MLGFVLRRLATSVVVVFAVATASFLLLHAAPGGPFDTDARRSPAVQAAMEQRYGLHDSTWTQYGRELAHLARGDLGHSIKREVTVDELIATRFPVSAVVGVLGLAMALGFGVVAGALAAWRRRSWLDRAVRVVAVLALAVPAFVIGPLLVAWFSIRLGWLPPSRVDGPASYVLPAIALGLVYFGAIARLTRAGMVDALDQDFVRTARAKGLGEGAVVARHALRVGIVPVVSYLGPAAAAMIAGSFVVEKIFQLPGLGASFVTSIADRDYPVLTGVFVFYAVLVVALDLAVDVAYGVLDPRARLA